jgi:predicted RNA-binding protein with PUA-like domain
MARRYWLMKTEPDVFSFADLISRRHQTEGWDGIRNYQARNLLRDEVQIGDQAFIYHSRIAEPAIVGIAEVVKGAYPDDSALDPASKYFDPLSKKQGASRWVMIDVKAIEKFSYPVTLGQMRLNPDLADLMVIKKGQRLSIQPVSKSSWDIIKRLGKPKPV